MMVILKNPSESSSFSLRSKKDQKYDVFLSFRGTDTRLSFTNHLHNALKDANLKTFLDDDEIHTGVSLKPELVSAIKASRASVIVLSKNYAFSTWCLDELVSIVDQYKNFNQIVIPIFYHVEPNDVRKQQNSFRDAMEKHKKRMEEEKDVEKKYELATKIEIWKEALTQVTDLKGKNAKGRPETELIKEVIDDIYHILGGTVSSCIPLLIGMEKSVKFITSWLKDVSSNTVDILTIFGMSGIGKTSVANHVYELYRREFDACSFIEDISRKCVAFGGILCLQKQLLGNIIKTSPVEVHRVSEYTSHIENTISRKRVFVVLDDIDSVDQLDKLLGNKGLHSGSKILITSKEMSLTEKCALFNLQIKPNHTQYLLGGLYDDASLRLLCFHAFKCEEIEEGYEEVSNKIVKYCGGHPLALKVLGSSLHKQDVTYWEEYIDLLRQEPEGAINNILKKSFDNLSNNDKELFKHIACFFIGMKREFIEMILKACDINTRIGITHLLDKCLLNEDKHCNVLTMHSLIQELGRNEVRHESPEKPEERSRLWRHTESYKVLKKKTGTRNIKGLSLDMNMIQNEKLRGSLFMLETNALREMDELKLLQLNFVQLSGSYKKFPKKLRWLCMQYFPLESLPSDLPMKKLVALDMSYSNITSFDMSSSNLKRPQKRQKLTGSSSNDTRLLGSLKILDVSFCKQLRSLGGFYEIHKLERLTATNCIDLIEICESIEQCFELTFINLSYCNKLEKLHLGKLEKVKTLLLDSCNFGKCQIEMSDIDSPEMLKLDKTCINSQKSYSSSFVMAIPRNLKFLALSFPSSLVRLSLAENNLASESFPADLSSLALLKEFVLDNNPIVSMPDCVRTLPRLEKLSMNSCEMLTSIKHPPPTLTVLSTYCSSELTNVVFDQEMSPMLLGMVFFYLASLSLEIEGVAKVQPIADIDERVLCSLGWSNLDFTKNEFIITYTMNGEQVESQIQMYYQFGIFSIYYSGDEMPNWISERKHGSSISFTIPSSSKNLTGLNICYVLFSKDYIDYPTIRISNITKKRTWLYYLYRDSYSWLNGGYVTYMSHWMFETNDMKPGDHVTIDMLTKVVDEQLIRECGVSFVYDDGNIEKEDEDALIYYKSWNHRIGGDLSPFQLTTGEYLLDIRNFARCSKETLLFTKYVSPNARFIDMQVLFKAFSHKKSNILDRAIEIEGVITI